LIVRGDVDRLTRDLDFFTVEPNTVDVLLPAFEAAARKAGLTVVEEQAAHGFARLVVSDGTDQTGVDLASDARLFASEPSELGRILSAEELAVDKVLAVFGRAEARDFVDLAALEPRFGLAHLCELAGRKDTGFRRPVQPRCSTGSIAWTGTSSTSTTRRSPPSSSRSGGGDPSAGDARLKPACGPVGGAERRIKPSWGPARPPVNCRRWAPDRSSRLCREGATRRAQASGR